MSENKRQLELIYQLSNDLGVTLEMGFTPHELRELWGEALVNLVDAKCILESNGMKAPDVIESVTRLAESELSSK